MEVLGLVLVPFLFLCGVQAHHEGTLKFVKPTKAEIQNVHAPWENPGSRP